MSTEICRSCGGILGRDCFNPQECALIVQQQAVEIVPCRDCQQLQATTAAQAKELAELSGALEKIAKLWNELQEARTKYPQMAGGVFRTLTDFIAEQTLKKGTK